ncbi:MAG TPA: A/G-specific adenine glycosylase [Actinomycetota bacterium]|nr:A/G-specific adenine glycosylase [Actinomycetota bacterium]
MRNALLDWYRPRRRMYPWRSARPDPYGVLVSEVMLQQTQVARVVPAFREFVRRFPTVRSLAAAPRREVLRAWSGLGYNRRAVGLSEAARAIVTDYEGRVPSAPETLRTLPGVGPYTAAAVASLAFGIPVPALDTNAARVVARTRLGAEPYEVRRKTLEVAAAGWLDHGDPGAWNQALMDLGREVCQPVPRCAACPLSGSCRFRAEGREGAPAKRPRSPFPGSIRRVRGVIILLLRDRTSASVGALAREIGEPRDRVVEAIGTLARDGLVEASGAAMQGRPGGRVRLSEA